MSDLPRLLLCCFDVVPAPTAISRRLTEYVKGLSDRYQVVVLTVKTPEHTHIERYHGARLLRVPVGSGDLAARVQSFDRAVRRQLESEEYVMVHFFDPFGGYALCERRVELGYKLVYDACSLPSVDLPFLVDEAEANRRFIARVRRQELYCLMNADVVIVANELTREFVTGLGVAREQVQVLPAPVDLGPYDPRVMGVPDATPMKLLHLGNLSSAQDLGTVLEAMQIALKSVDVRLTVVGPRHPEHQARLEDQVAALELTGKVEFQDPVAHDDLHKVLATADVGLLTLADVERNSRVGSPLSRLGEYLAAGRPVLAADVAAARALLPDDGVVLYRPQDKHSLADAIVGLASEPARRVKLGAAARAASLERDAAKIRADLVATYVALSGTGVRAVGDADQTSPDEVTQLGRSLDSEDTQRRKAAAQHEPPSGTNKVKTDPAIAGADTSPEGSLGADRPAVMGVPIHEEEPPVVMGTEAQAIVAEFVQVTTEPNAHRSSEPPVVMGTPLNPPSLSTFLTPEDLAAELEEVRSPPTPASLPPELEAAEAPPLGEDLPDTGGHLSLVPRVPTPPEVPVAPPEPLAPAADEPLFIPPLELPSEPLRAAPPPVLAPPRSSPSGLSFEPGSGFVPLLTPPAPFAPTLAPPRTASGLQPAFVPPPPAPVVEPLPAFVPPAAPIAPPRTASGIQPAFTPAAAPLAPPRTASGIQPAFAPTAAPLSAPRTASGIQPAFAPAAAPLSPPRTASGIQPAFAPAAASLSPPRTTSEIQPAFAPAAASLSPPRTASGLQPAFAPAAGPLSPPRTASEIQPVFAPTAAPMTPAPARTTSGVLPVFVAPAFKSSPSTIMPAVVVPEGVPPPLPRTASGIFQAAGATTPSGAALVENKQQSGLFPRAPDVPTSLDEAEAIGEDEFEDVGDDGPLEVSADEIVELTSSPSSANVDESPMMTAEDSAVMTVDTDPSPPASAIDPWLAQLVHGYCPPESGLFERHTPPTTMPGRDT